MELSSLVCARPPLAPLTREREKWAADIVLKEVTEGGSMHKILPSILTITNKGKKGGRERKERGEERKEERKERRREGGNRKGIKAFRDYFSNSQKDLPKTDCF